MLVIGLTGGIGTGKTEVAHVLRELGALVIEADKVAHLSYEPGTAAHSAVARRFGNGVLDDSGVIDRDRLGKVVFSDSGLRRELEAIVWPAARNWITARLLEEEKRGSNIVVIEVPKLFESGWDELVDIVWTVEAPEGEISRRVGQRSRLSESDTNARIAAQFTRQERVARADSVIENDATFEVLRTRTSKLWESLS
ncbi:MAG TPA: dephospho-CoA kinase [Dehalococcoidia bacterium]|nr:dephospho-CoA kinase [Dehalococcoidia bacterium]MDP7089914.1 dephospho-CoA kinase [Dehalococcoidia bacterium]MDP7261583.1 dephospho-CoA kinase [Dehalococcoidia bacterium]MDP7485590.1 dephospho-CoA kinase [Dehalococcoidia bacterium]HJP27768.1 dephospho-CoA kinase [Dehalococcoidia bacterium]